MEWYWHYVPFSLLFGQEKAEAWKSSSVSLWSGCVRVREGWVGCVASAHLRATFLGTCHLLNAVLGHKLIKLRHKIVCSLRWAQFNLVLHGSVRLTGSGKVLVSHSIFRGHLRPQLLESFHLGCTDAFHFRKGR